MMSDIDDNQIGTFHHKASIPAMAATKLAVHAVKPFSFSPPSVSALPVDVVAGGSAAEPAADAVGSVVGVGKYHEKLLVVVGISDQSLKAIVGKDSVYMESIEVTPPSK